VGLVVMTRTVETAIAVFVLEFGAFWVRMRTGVVVGMLVVMSVGVDMAESCETNDVDQEPKDADYEQFIKSAKLGAFP
jgi:hypothetical protein